MQKVFKISTLFLFGIMFFGCSSDDGSSNSENLIGNLFLCQPNNGNPSHIYPCDLTLDSQNDIDIFSQGGFTEIDGVLTIEGQDISNLNGLSSLVKVDNLKIQNNPLLQNISGLINLKTYILIIKNNSTITNLQGVCKVINQGSNFTSTLTISDNSNLINLLGVQELPLRINFVIENNSELKNLQGLENTTIVNVGQWRIENNQKLESLNGMNNLTSMRWLQIFNNHLLQDVKLNSLDTITERLQIGWNNSLTNLNNIDNLSNVASLVLNDNNALIDISNFSTIIETNEIIVQSNSSLENFCTIEDLYNSGVLSNGDWTRYDNGFQPDIINQICQP